MCTPLVVTIVIIVPMKHFLVGYTHSLSAGKTRRFLPPDKSISVRDLELLGNEDNPERGASLGALDEGVGIGIGSCIMDGIGCGGGLESAIGSKLSDPPVFVFVSTTSTN
jgi:hypothetical protein